MDSKQAVFFVQLAPDWGWASYKGADKPLRGIKAAGITQQRPDRPRPGTVVVKLTVEVPSAAFFPLRPEAVVSIPAAMTEPHPIIVEAVDPHEVDEEAA